MQDSEIVAAYFARDRSALEETRVKYGRLCYSVAYNILHSREDSEECENDTYLTAWSTIPPQRPVYLSAYLCAITRNLALKRYAFSRTKKRNRALDISLSELSGAAADGDVEREAEFKELGERISEFLYTLPEEERSVFIRRYVLFDGIREIARDFGGTQSRIKSMLARTRKKLGAYLEKYYEEDGI